MSVMNLADYSTVQVGPGCLAEFLAGLLASVRGPETPQEPPVAPDGPMPAEAAEAAALADLEASRAKPRTAHPRGSRRGG